MYSLSAVGLTRTQKLCLRVACEWGFNLNCWRIQVYMAYILKSTDSNTPKSTTVYVYGDNQHQSLWTVISELSSWWAQRIEEKLQPAACPEFGRAGAVNLTWWKPGPHRKKVLRARLVKMGAFRFCLWAACNWHWSISRSKFSCYLGPKQFYINLCILLLVYIKYKIIFLYFNELLFVSRFLYESMRNVCDIAKSMLY